MDEQGRHQIDTIGDWKRTHDCGGLRNNHVGDEVILMGWVNSRRDLGNLIFIDLRDREGITQVVFDPQGNPEAHERAHILRNEWVVAVRGKVSLRLKGRENTGLPTGDIELNVLELKILNRTQTPPFQVDGTVDASETLRLKYRYLELRRPRMFHHFKKRHLIGACIRNFLDRRGFMDVETPILTKSTPEGARDYLVPSRVNKGMFYALPQSPQLFKQLLMVAGFDRYYQIVRCFRDEDLRSDRQPEFTQVDLEMSFVHEDDVMDIFEEMMIHIFEEVLDVQIPSPIARITYKEAMARFGTDRPDMRFDMELVDLSAVAERSDFKLFQGAIEAGGSVKAICVKGGAQAYSRKALDELTSIARTTGAKGLAWIKIKDKGEWQSSIAKFFSDDDKRSINEEMEAQTGDLILIVADQRQMVHEALSAIRLKVAKQQDLIHNGEYAFVWVTEFPLLEYDEKEKRFAAVHHPFTSPFEEDLDLLDEAPSKVRARAYDLVLNGSEIGGGSIRIHSTDIQEKIFRTLGISSREAQSKFGFLLDALKYGAPPHGGMALGFDRLVAIMTGVESIREIIAFPKTTSAACLLSEAPSMVDSAQLEELGLRVEPDLCK